MSGLKKNPYLTVRMGSFGNEQTTITASNVIAALDSSVGVVGIATEVEACAKKYNMKEVQVHEKGVGAGLIDVLRARGKVAVNAIREVSRDTGKAPELEMPYFTGCDFGFPRAEAADILKAAATHLGDRNEDPDAPRELKYDYHPEAPDILKAAAAHMEDRKRLYDKPEGERSMPPTVAAFNAITGHNLTEEQGWLFMELLKAVRAEHNGYRPDNYEDGAAYCALKGEAAARNRGESST